MLEFLHTKLGQLRLVSFAEGISYVLLLFIAMPLKYLAGFPMAVTIVGSIHGLLFVIFLVALVRVAFSVPWTLPRVLTAFVAAVLPLCAFFFDRSLKREIDERMKSAGSIS